MPTIDGLAPPKGTGTVSVSTTGSNELTEVIVDPETKLLTLDPAGNMRLQWVGNAGDAGNDAISVQIRSGGPTELDIPGWESEDGKGRFFLYSVAPSTDCIVLAQRSRP